MRKLITIIVIGTLLLTIAASAADVPKTEDQKTLYAIGLAVARSLTTFSLTPKELEFVKQGITDGVTGKKPAVDLSSYGQKVQELGRARRKIQGDKQAPANKAFLEKTAREKGAVKTGSGMVYIPSQEGTGASPGATEKVKINFRGTLIDGTEFDSSYKRGTPVELPLTGVIKCLTEGLQMMKPGGKAKLVCPSALAYGDTGAGELILPGATLVFEIELLEAIK